MKKIVFIILSFLVSLAFISLVNAAVVFEEYVTKAEVKQYYASMSEILEKSVSLDRLTPIFDANPTLKYIKNEEFKRQQREVEKHLGGGD